jgi:uncharacterized membrane protein
MTRRRATAVVLCLLAVGAAVVAPAASAVEISVDRPSVSTRLGQSFNFSSTITNTGRGPLTGLVAHLNVVGLTKGVYVDPEDWSPERTKDVPPLAPGQSATVPWTVTAVNGGRLAVYVVVVPRALPRTASSGLAVGAPMDLRVAERRTLNSGGVLFLALGVPGLLGLATVALRLPRRRSRRRRAADAA